MTQANGIRIEVDFNYGTARDAFGAVYLGTKDDPHILYRHLVEAFAAAGVAVEVGQPFIAYERHADEDEHGLLDLEVDAILRHDETGWFGEYDPRSMRHVRSS